jgi:hypothetical protein
MVTKNTRPNVPTSFHSSVRARTKGIPQSFYLVGCQWTVKFTEDLTEYGKCDCTTFTIYLRSGMNKNFTEQTFFHELVHAVMFAMGHTSHDEVFVDSFGALLHQYEKTKL